MEELINFCWLSGPGYGFRITFPLRSVSIAEHGSLRGLLAFLRRTDHLPLFTKLGEVTDAISITFWE